MITTHSLNNSQFPVTKAHSTFRFWIWPDLMYYTNY